MVERLKISGSHAGSHSDRDRSAAIRVHIGPIHACCNVCAFVFYNSNK